MNSSKTRHGKVRHILIYCLRRHITHFYQTPVTHQSFTFINSIFPLSVLFWFDTLKFRLDNMILILKSTFKFSCGSSYKFKDWTLWINPSHVSNGFFCYSMQTKQLTNSIKKVSKCFGGFLGKSWSIEELLKSN